jgi:hypothetical protein
MLYCFLISLENAKRRANFLYYDSGQMHMGERITIAVIGTKDMVPITIRGVLRETIITTWITGHFGSKTTEREVAIPASVHRKAMPDDQSSISLAQLSASGADMWLSIREIRHSNLRVPASKGHWYEWLACGVIPRSRVSAVWPFDGRIVHHKPSKEPIRSIKSTENWVFHWEKQMWMLEGQNARKRREATDEAEEEGNGVPEQGRSKRRKRDNAEQEDDTGSEDEGKHCATCTCGQRQASSSPDNDEI